MYRIVIFLPFDVAGVWHKPLEKGDADTVMKALPDGFEIVEETRLDDALVGLERVIIPFDREFVDNVSQ